LYGRLMPSAAAWMVTVMAAALLVPSAGHTQSKGSRSRNAVTACIESTKTFYNKEWERTFDTTRSPRYTLDDAKKARRKFGMGCSSSYNVSSAPDSLLVPLATLYTLIDEDSLARSAVRRSLSGASLPAATQAERLVTAAETFAKDTTGILQARKYAGELAAMGPEYLTYRLRAMIAVLTLYQKAALYDQSLVYGDSVLALEPADLSAKSPARPLLAQALLVLAFTNAEAGRGSAAVWCAERLVYNYKGTSQANVADSALPRFRMLGRRAPTVVGDFWLNPSTTVRSYTPEPGHAAVIMFATYWCDSCHAICKSFERLHQKYGLKGNVDFRVITRTNSVISNPRKPPTMAQQIADVKTMFVDRFGLSMPIAIEAIDTTRALSTGESDNEHRYKVDGYPMFALIDTQGRVRLLSTGWGNDSERRLSAWIVEMIGELAPGKREQVGSTNQP
jgi:thiol-disulfide isomerase/thioredoxin